MAIKRSPPVSTFDCLLSIYALQFVDIHDRHSGQTCLKAGLDIRKDQLIGAKLRIVRARSASTAR